MIRIRQGRVVQVLASTATVDELLVTVEGQEARAVNYSLLTGPVKIGDVVSLNTTAVHKSLGTGGQHFVMANLSVESVDTGEPGHIMKLRYTPGQVKCLAVEEEDSPCHQAMVDADSLAGMPVIASTLHSMLPLITAGIRSVNSKLKIAFLMTDGAALPLWFSKMAALLKNKGWIHSTITVGHAFGGDLEAVNIYSGLLAAKVVVGADLAVVGMGPGIVGTGTPFGFTGTEQGEVVNAINILGGQAVAVPRISFADARERHKGLSHQTATALGKVALAKAKVVIHNLMEEKMELVKTQLADSGVSVKHEVLIEDGTPAVDLVKEEGIKVTTMGRNLDQDADFFLTCGAAGRVGARLV